MSHDTNIEVSGPFALQIENGRHYVTPAGREHILFASNLPYPTETANPIADILLKPCRPEIPVNAGQNCFELPEHYLPLGAVLNEALSSESSRSDQYLSGFFRDMAQTIRSIKKSGQGVPQPFSYRQVLVKSNVAGFSLLPPLVMETDANRTQQAAGLLADVLGNELQDSAGSLDRKRRIVKVFAAFKEGIAEV